MITVVALLCFRIIGPATLLSLDYTKWAICQVTFFQFYTPEYLQVWGVGVPNGSLWTIAVELLFYLFLPLIILMLKKAGAKIFYSIIMAIFILSIVTGVLLKDMDNQLIYNKLLHISLAPYFHYFFLGIVTCLNWEHIKKFFTDKFHVWLIVYGVYSFFFSFTLHLYEPSYYPNLFGWIST